MGLGVGVGGCLVGTVGGVGFDLVVGVGERGGWRWTGEKEFDEGAWILGCIFKPSIYHSSKML